MKIFVPTKRNAGGFSLVEVVVAVGIFAISIVAVIGLLGPTNKSISEVRDTDDATRVVNAIQAQLQSLAETSAGWTLLTSGTNSYLRSSASVQLDDASALFDPSDSNPANGGGYTFFSTRDGARINLYKDGVNSRYWIGASPSDPTTLIDNWDGIKYFEITLIRNDTLSPSGNDATAGFLAFTIRLRWPAYLPNGRKLSDNTQKSILLVPAAVHR